jgi:hypothetical protein
LNFNRKVLKSIVGHVMRKLITTKDLVVLLIRFFFREYVNWFSNPLDNYISIRMGLWYMLVNRALIKKTEYSHFFGRGRRDKRVLNNVGVLFDMCYFHSSFLHSLLSCFVFVFFFILYTSPPLPNVRNERVASRGTVTSL